MKLRDKVAVITGAGTGIGRAIAELFAREGAAVVLAGRRREPLEEVARGITAAGGRALAQTADVTRQGEVEALVRAAVETFGGLHIVVNNAACWMGGTIEETSDEDWQRMLDTNLTGVFRLTKAALPALRRSRGTVVNIGSILGLVGMKRRLAYATSKGGLVQFTRALAIDYAAEGIRANCICPSLVETPMGSESLARGGPVADAQKELARRISQIPLGRAGRPEDVAQMALFLASDDSSWVTGAALPLDGGFSAY